MQPNIIGLRLKSATVDRPSLQELLGEWTQVASTRQYCPSQNDINRPLRMAAWMSFKGRDRRDSGEDILGVFFSKTLQV